MTSASEFERSYLWLNSLRSISDSLERTTRDWRSATATSRLMREWTLETDQVRRAVLMDLGAVQTGLSRMWEQFNSSPIREWFIGLRQPAQLAMQFPSVMASVGWPPPRGASLALVREVISLSRGDDARRGIDRLMVEAYSSDAIEELLSTWHSRLPCRRRLHILDAAVAAHLRGDYYCSVPVLLAQCEGLIVDGTGHRGRMTGPDLRKHVDELFDRRDTKGLRHAINDAVYDFFVSEVIVPFEHGKEIASSLSRHAIMHGGDVGYGTASSSLKALLLLDFFQSPFDFAAVCGRPVYHSAVCKRAWASRNSLTFFRSRGDAEMSGLRPCSFCRSATVDS